MRILVMTNLYPNPYQPNRATFNRAQLRAVAERGPVTVIAPILWTDELAARRRVGNKLPATRRLRFDNLDVIHPIYYYTPKVFRDWYGHFFAWSVKPYFRQVVAEFRPELIFAPWVFPDGWAALRLGRQVDVPVVVKAHGSDVLLSRQFRGRQRRTVEALQGADHVVTVSQDLARHVVAANVPAARVQVIYDGVDKAAFHAGDRAAARRRLGLAAADKIVLFVGNLIHVKGLDYLLQACDLLAARCLLQVPDHWPGPAAPNPGTRNRWPRFNGAGTIAGRTAACRTAGLVSRCERLCFAESIGRYAYRPVGSPSLRRAVCR